MRSPGPWRTGDLFHAVFGPPTGDPSPETIATLHSGNRENARLISAAPELLDAAEIALALLRGSGFTENTKAIIALRMAIAKAEGR